MWRCSVRLSSKCRLYHHRYLSSNANALTSSTATASNATANSSCSQPLGTPLPYDEHACSVSLPTWSSVVGYEEGCPVTTAALKCGYPRFVYHPYILQLMNQVVAASNNNNIDCLVLPTWQAARRCQLFLQQAVEQKAPAVDNAMVEATSSSDNNQSTTTSSSASNNNNNSTSIRIESLGVLDLHAVTFPATTLAGSQAKAYWQHGGELVSSRAAAYCLQKQFNVDVSQWSPIDKDDYKKPSQQQPQSNSDPHLGVRQLIAQWARVPNEDCVFLTPSGMASLYTALRAARRISTAPKRGTSIVYGFPYLDTLKLCSRYEICPGGVEFFGHGDSGDLHKLQSYLNRQRQQGNSICTLITEVPSNPLLQCPDLHALRALADEYNFALVVDDTIGNFLNVNLLESGLADAVCTSLTKLVSGKGDVMGGSVVFNPYTKLGKSMLSDMQNLAKNSNDNHDSSSSTIYNGGLYEADAAVLLENAQDFPQRNDIINDNAEKLADWLHEHPDVKQVYYPKLSKSSVAHYKKVQTGGYGGLLSILLDSHICQRTFYDVLNVAKGPSLGTNFTLVCPYTLLAHYHELDFAMTYNVQPNLVRIAVGLEDYESELRPKFEHALQVSRLHPKLPTMTTTNDSSSSSLASNSYNSQQVRAYSTTRLMNENKQKKSWTFPYHKLLLMR